MNLAHKAVVKENLPLYNGDIFIPWTRILPPSSMESSTIFASTRCVNSLTTNGFTTVLILPTDINLPAKVQLNQILGLSLPKIHLNQEVHSFPALVQALLLQCAHLVQYLRIHLSLLLNRHPNRLKLSLQFLKMFLILIQEDLNLFALLWRILVHLMLLRLLSPLIFPTSNWQLVSGVTSDPDHEGDVWFNAGYVSDDEKVSELASHTNHSVLNSSNASHYSYIDA